MTFFYLAPWIVFFPVIGLLVNIIFGDRFSEKVIGTSPALLRACIRCLGFAGVFIDAASRCRSLDDWRMDSCRNLATRLDVPRRYAFDHDDAGGFRRWHADPYLRHRIYA